MSSHSVGATDASSGRVACANLFADRHLPRRASRRARRLRNIVSAPRTDCIAAVRGTRHLSGPETLRLLPRAALRLHTKRADAARANERAAIK